jgi:proteasome lid subunit RPN8/RPN11
LEAFQEYRPDIIEHAKNCYPAECCGLLGKKGKNIVWTPMENVSNSQDTFEMDPKEYTRQMLTQKILAVVHSHVNEPVVASQNDLIQCNALGIDYIIVDINGNWNHVKPLEGRPYVWKQYDCLTLVSDYYKMHYNFSVVWDDRDYDSYYETDYFSVFPQLGFKEVKDLSVGNAILFKVRSKVENHCAVYLGDGKILHHTENRVSSIQSLYPLWAKFKTRILKHESLFNG